jgi:3',5'-cyclic AMP phosphodiesterase CpdA
MRILHLSDIHMISENDKNFQTFIITPLLADIRTYHDEKNFDIVLITGDLINKGALEFINRNNCYQTFLKQFIEPILDCLSLALDKVYFVPGNHDVWRVCRQMVSDKIAL